MKPGELQIVLNRELQKQLAKTFNDFQTWTRQAVKDVINEEGALTCREAINYSPPLDGSGGGKGDKKVAERWGNWAVANDVTTVVTEDSRSLAAAVNSRSNPFDKFLKWKRGKPPKGSGFLDKVWRDENVQRAYARARNVLRKWNGTRNHQQLDSQAAIKLLHDNARKQYRGRIRKNGGRDIEGKLKGFGWRFADAKLLKDYIKLRQSRVGWMKAGWVSAISKIPVPVINGVPKQFGLRKLPAWITRHKGGHGGVGIYQTRGGIADSYAITVRNDLGNIFGVGYLAGTKEKVIEVRGNKMTLRMRHLMRAALEKANKGQKPT